MKLLSWSLLSLTLVACAGAGDEEVDEIGDEAALRAFRSLPPKEFVKVTSCEGHDHDHVEADAGGATTDEEAPELIEFAQPSGYGSLDDNTAARCTTWSDPVRCIVADDKTLKFKVNVTTPTNLGLRADLLRGAFAFAVAQTDGQINWTLNISGTQESESANTVTSAATLKKVCGSSTVIGCAAQTLDKKFTSNGRLYWKSKRCSIYINPNNVKWSTDPTEQLWQAYNIYKHEIGHCLGLGHSSRGLMRSAGAAETKTALDFDAGDVQNINNYEP